MKKKLGIIKRVTCLGLVFLLSINSFAAIVSDNDGSAFITKSEFDALKASFQSQIDSYNTSIDSKIDGAIAAYLSGITVSKISISNVKNIFDSLSTVPSSSEYLVGKKVIFLPGKNNQKWAYFKGATAKWFDGGAYPAIYYHATFGIKLTRDFTGHEVPIGNDWFLYLYSQVSPRNGSNANVVAHVKDGNKIQKISYGMRCSFITNKRATFKLGANSWQYTAFAYAPNTAKDGLPRISWSWNAPSAFALDTTGTGTSNTSFSWFNKNVHQWLFARKGSPTAAYPKYEPSFPLIDRTVDSDITTSNTLTKDNWCYVYPGLTACDASINGFSSVTTGAYNDEGRMADNELTFGDSATYFFPNEDGTKQIYKFHDDNFDDSFERYDFPLHTDGTGYTIEELNALPDDDKVDNFQGTLFTQYNEVVKDMINYHNTKYPDNKLEMFDDFNKLTYKGYHQIFKKSNMVGMNTLVWPSEKFSFGKELPIAECPPLVCNVADDGELEVTGGVRFSYINSTTSPDPQNDLLDLYFSPNGRSDESEISPGYWTVNNALPFRYRKLGDDGWSPTVTTLLISQSAGSSPIKNTDFLEFQIDVNKDTDVYIHEIARCKPTDPNNTGYLYQCLDIIANEDLKTYLTVTKE